MAVLLPNVLPPIRSAKSCWMYDSVIDDFNRHKSAPVVNATPIFSVTRLFLKRMFVNHGNYPDGHGHAGRLVRSETIGTARGSGADDGRTARRACRVDAQGARSGRGSRGQRVRQSDAVRSSRRLQAIP